MRELIYLSVAFPLLGFLLNGIFGSKIKSEKIIGWIGSGTVGLAFIISAGAFIQTLLLPVESRSYTVQLFTWISTGWLDIKVSYLVDQLSLIMILVVTGVGFLIHVYSIGYMHGDKGFWRFFAYLNLFIFAMMNLVLADNFVLLFLGWEGVGLCSYLLIGFWYDRKFEKGTTSEAAKKAFIVNRIGDFGFLLAMFLIFMAFDSLNFNDVFSKAQIFSVSPKIFNYIALFLFIGATGKSAQIPLYIWLPDAMAGPTPVSALIHAATMVTAGIYMVARCSIIFAFAPAVLSFIAVIGLLTAFFAATVGLVQNDIKKILAYSTISQLGYMFLALGVGAFSAGVFHLMTHAFFKALLFLGAGSIIHAMHDKQDIQQYGGLKNYMPVTYATFMIAALTISGFPGLSGFFSKDEILWNAYNNGSLLLWIVGVVTALMTAFYMFRLVSLTFFGKTKFSHDIHPHESPRVMTVPLVILAFLSIVGGYVGVPEIFSGEGGNIFHTWLKPVFSNAERKLEFSGTHSNAEEIILMAISLTAILAAMRLAYTIYTRRIDIANSLSSKYRLFYNLLLNKYYIDEIYETLIVKPIQRSSEIILWKFTDNRIIDGLVNGSAEVINKLGGFIRRLQTGVVQFYALIMVAGIAAALLWIILSL